MKFEKGKMKTPNPSLIKQPTSKENLPSISVVTPTFNSEKTLEQCLNSIANQDYPQELVEVIIVDAGSDDRTLEIAHKYTNRIYPNNLKTGEAGKAAGVKEARNEIIALIDSDNVLPEKNWFQRMVTPFHDPEIVGSEPLYYTYRKEDGYITRYCAFLGMNDPLCLFLGNYDRYSALTGKWTEMAHKEENKGDYLKIELQKRYLPTIGANGFFIRRNALKKCRVNNYLFDIDVVYELLNLKNETNSTKSIRFAKVKTGIIHIFSGDLKTFARKQRRRINDYLYYRKIGARKYPWQNTSKSKLLKFILSCLTVFPLLFQTLKGYIKKPDKAWLFHPVACWLTLWEYGRGIIAGLISVRQFNRDGWKQ